MDFNNLTQVVFTEEELQAIDSALASLETVLAPKTTGLNAEQRKQYGSIAEQNKLFVGKAKHLMEKYPQYVPPFVDKAEFDRDFLSREQIEDRLMNLKRLTELLSDTKVLLDHDNYTNALSFYRNIKFLNRENIPGITSIYQELKQFFTGKKAPKETNTGE